MCWKEDKSVVGDTTNHRGTRMVFLAMNSVDISEEAKVLTVITTILSRDSMKMTSSSDDIKQKE
jgi:hypothetical protein